MGVICGANVTEAIPTFSCQNGAAVMTFTMVAHSRSVGSLDNIWRNAVNFGSTRSAYSAAIGCFDTSSPSRLANTPGITANSS